MTSADPPAILVVGAGPVGLTLAAELARYGVGARIIDKSAALRPIAGRSASRRGRSRCS